MAFEGLSEKLSAAFKKLKNRGQLGTKYSNFSIYWDILIQTATM